MTQPLSGIRILDFSTLLPGPMATLMLAEAGADVIKIERPGKGDEMRRDNGDFAQLNRGKRSLTIDLKSADDLRRLLPLIAAADVLVEQFRPGVMDRLGLGYEALKALNPRLIYCSINGYGSTGPNALKPGHDLTYAAESGLLSQTAATDGAPAMPPVMIADVAGGSYPAVINILLALMQRERSGEGCYVEIAMFDQIFPLLQPCFSAVFGRGHWPQPNDAPETGAAPRYCIYRTADDRFIAAAPVEEKFWQNFCAAIGLAPGYIDDKRDPQATKAAVAAAIRSRSAADWERRLEGLDVACAVVRTFEEALNDRHFRSRGLLTRQVNYGATSMPALPVPVADCFRLDRIAGAAPALGEANAELLP